MAGILDRILGRKVALAQAGRRSCKRICKREGDRGRIDWRPGSCPQLVGGCRCYSVCFHEDGEKDITYAYTHAYGICMRAHLNQHARLAVQDAHFHMFKFEICHMFVMLKHIK